MKLTADEIVETYGQRPKVEAFIPSSLEDFARTSTPDGLVWDMGLLLVQVTAADGTRYALSRGWCKSLTGLWMTSVLDPDLSVASPRLFKRQYSGPIDFDLDDEAQTARISSWSARHNFSMELAPGRIHWEEEDGSLNLDFTLLGPALKLSYAPGEGYERAILTSQFFAIRGELDGREVSGMGAFDQAWLPAGIGFTQSTTYTHIQNLWMPWTTRYDDGSTEYGVVARGVGNWDWGFHVRDGVAVTDVVPSITTETFAVDGVEVPVASDVAYGDDHYRWTANGRIGIVKGKMNWVSGAMARLGTSATPIETYAWREFRVS